MTQLHTHALLAIDPSIHNLGITLLDQGSHIVALDQVKVRGAQYGYMNRAWAISRYISTVYLATHIIDFSNVRIDVVIESPENWHGERGRDSKNNEAVQKLYWFVGCLSSALTLQEEISSVWVVTPTAWKGQTPKDVMVRRAKTFAHSRGLTLPEKVPHDACEALLLAKFTFPRWHPETNQMDDPLISVDSQQVFVETEFNVESFVD